MCGIELKFVPHVRCDMDSNQKRRLCNAMLKHKKVLANLVDVKLNEFEEIDSPISALDNKTIRQLIMDLETESGEKIFTTIERSWQGDLTAWVKRKCKAEAEVFTTHMAAWLVKLHGSSIMTKLDPDIQKIVKTVEWREGVPLYPEEAETEDASKIELDWLIDIKELELARGDDKSVTMDDITIGLFGDQSFFSTNQTQNQDDKLQGNFHQSLALRELDTSTGDTEHELDQTTTVVFAQGSKGVEGHSKLSALT